MGFTQWNLTDRFFCVHAMYEYEYFMGVKGIFTMYPIVKRNVPETSPVCNSVNRNKWSVELQVSHLKNRALLSPAKGQKLFRKAFLV